MARSRVQPSLIVGPANDRFEREADQAAAQVLATAAPVHAAAASGRPTDAVRQLRRQETLGLGGQPSLDELDAVPPLEADQVEPEVGPEEEVTLEGLDHGDAAELETGEPEPLPEREEALPQVPEFPAGAFPPAPAEIQEQAAGDGPALGPEGGPAPPEVAARVATAGRGRPLPDETRAYMEPRFIADFGSVRIHMDAADQAVARRLGARAFTHGRQIWLGPGESPSDKRLMAHELAHVLQQTPRLADRKAATPPEPPAPAKAQRGYIRDRIARAARNIPGYTLFSVIIGQDPISGDRVERNAINIIGGFMGLLGPLGNQAFEWLKESKILEEAFAWVKGKLTEYNITVERIWDVVRGAWDAFELTSPIASLKRHFGPLVSDIKNFAIDALLKMLEFAIRGALRLAGGLGDQIWGVIAQGIEVIGLIAKDPLGFARNLFRAVVGGFEKFGTNIVDHLKRGLLSWLFGAIKGLDIELPARLDLKGLLWIGLQVVGLTYQRVREVLVKRLEPAGERKMRYVERAVSFVATLVRDGIVGVWQKALEYFENFKEIVVEGIKGWVKSAIITAGIKWLAGLSNPIGGIIQAAISIYKVVETFIRNISRFAEIVSGIFGSIGKIARGSVTEAVDLVEATLGRLVPVVIGFIAAVLQLPDVAKTVRGIVDRLRAKVTGAIERFVAFVVKKAKKLFAAILRRLNLGRTPPGATFTIGRTRHRYFAKKVGRKLELFVATEEKPAKQAEAEVAQEAQKVTPGGTTAGEAQALVQAMDTTEATTAETAARVRPEDATQSTRGPLKTLEEKIAAGARLLSEAGAALGDNPDVDTEDPKLLIRAVEPRFEAEGTSGPYAAMKGLSAEPAPGTGLTYSQYYEADHLPEKSLLQAVNERLPRISEAAGQAAGPGAAPPVAPEETLRGTDPAATGAAAAQPAREQAPPPGFGRLAELADAPGGEGKSLHATLLYRPVHRTKPSTFTKDTLPAIDAALAKSDAAARETAVKEAMQKQIGDETAALKKIYVELDKNSAGAVRRRVFEGLDKLVEQTNVDFKLNAKAAPHTEAEIGAGGTAGARNALAFGGPQDFDDQEGKADAYGRFGLTGPYFERDHIIDQAFPANIQGATFGDPDVAQKGNLDPEPFRRGLTGHAKGAVTRRANRLAATPLFAPGSRMTTYTEGSGWAILLYRPVHRRVTLATRSPDARSILLDALPGAAFEKARAYLRGDEGARPEDARGEIHAEVRKAFTAQFATHERAVLSDYEGERARVRAANPGREQAAEMAL
ncbi:MAG TPA: DUF4157 domain-containing protein, partial [Geminicoccaceae bacterium]